MFNLVSVTRMKFVQEDVQFMYMRTFYYVLNRVNCNMVQWSSGYSVGLEIPGWFNCAGSSPGPYSILS